MEDNNSHPAALNQLAAPHHRRIHGLKRSGQLLYLLQISVMNIGKTRFEQLFDSVRRPWSAITPRHGGRLQAAPAASRRPPPKRRRELYRGRDEWIKTKEETGEQTKITSRR